MNSLKSKRAMSAANQPALSEPVFAWRLLVVGVCVGAALLMLFWRVVELHVVEQEFLSNEGDLRTVRTLPVLASRGSIFDRHGEPLAISAPVYDVYANPVHFRAASAKADADDRLGLQAQQRELAALLDLESGELNKALEEQPRQFVYLARRISPELASAVENIDLPGIYLERGYKRYYPAGEVTGHLVGFTDIDEQGQEGLELVFDEVLQGVTGSRKVLIDAKRRTIKPLHREPAAPGRDLHLSIDLRLQFYAYRELKAAVQAHNAEGGSLVMMDVESGEVLAMVNQPGFNPNNRATLQPEVVRNRAITDVFEPGSTVKPFTVAAGLVNGTIRPQTMVDTSPGFMRLNGRTIRDLGNYGDVDVETVLVKSSNVGTTKIALKTGGDAVRDLFYSAGLGQATGIEFPGESVGRLPSYTRWKPVNLATLSYGYGLSVTALQLTQAYSMLANGGQRHVPTLLKGGSDSQPAEQVLPAGITRSVNGMLEKAVLKGGTGGRAQTDDYRVAGKTGTAHKVGSKGYEEDQYLAVFSGFAPVSDPRLAMVVVISGPQEGEYYGGEVAAPVFSRVMSSALRILNEVPDKPAAKVARLKAGDDSRG